MDCEAAGRYRCVACIEAMLTIKLGPMTSTPLPELALSDDDRKVVNLLEAAPPSRARHCFRSAIDHLRRALLIQQIDPAMAVFRGITAEEEAASGLMHALIQRNYPNANLLKPRDHVQKHAVTPFLRSLLRHLAEIKLNGVSGVRLAITEIEGATRLAVVLLLEGEAEPQPAIPVPPLNLSLSDGTTGHFLDLSRNVRDVLKSFGYTNVLSFLQAEANLRNQILYAAQDGYPLVEDLKPEYILDRQRRVLTILKTTLLILPYEDVQPFASEALNSFLRLTKRLADTSPPHEA
jgi:hypothetical protein